MASRIQAIGNPFMRTPKFMILLLTALLLATVISPVHAQGDPSMLVSTTDATSNQTRILAIGDDLAGQELFNYAQADVEVSNIIISRDTQWVAMTLRNKVDSSVSVWYQHTGGTPVTIPNAQVDSFTPASTFLLYHWPLFQSFGVGIVNLSTGKITEFIGTRTAEQGLNNGAAMPLYFDGNVLYAVGFLPFSDAPLSGLYSFDLASNVADLATKSGRFDLPAAVVVADVTSYGGIPVVSPDGTQIAFLATDTSNPATNLPNLPFLPTTNTVYVVNLVTKTVSRLAQAGPGQLLLGLSWTGDSQGVVVAGGNYGSINTIYTASTAGNVQPLGSVATGTIWGVEVCGRYIYLTWSETADQSTAQIKRALLTDFTALQDVGTPDTMRLLGCSA
jgi:hypothetical protein